MSGEQASSGPLVVKIGGSLFETGRLQRVLKIIAGARRPLVIVPGGGPFADAVRRAQKRSKISDAEAHRLAIMGMHQMADLFFDLQPELASAESLIGIRRVWTAGKVAVWLPLKMAMRDTSIPQDWSITSDGLAARLAEQLGRIPVVLIKSQPLEPGIPVSALANKGIVDSCFAEITARAGLEWKVFGPGEEAKLARLIGAGSMRSRKSPKRA